MLNSVEGLRQAENLLALAAKAARVAGDAMGKIEPAVAGELIDELGEAVELLGELATDIRELAEAAKLLEGESPCN